MATFHQNPEEGRPPDLTPARRLPHRKSPKSPIDSWHNNSDKHPYLCSNSQNFDNNGFFEVETQLVHDLNKNVHVNVKKKSLSYKCNKMEKSSLKQTFPKLLCLKKSPVLFRQRENINRHSLKTLNVNTLSSDNYEKYLDKSASSYLNRSNSECKNCDTTNMSSSFCSSRIENSKKNRNSFHQNVEEAMSSLLWQPYEYQLSNNSPPASSFSSYSSPSSSYDDLDKITKNDGSSEQCSFTDLHLPTLTSEMVINLQATNLTDQSACRSLSHDERTIRSTSWLSDVFSLTEESGESESCGNVNCCDMQVNVPLNSPTVTQTNVLHIGASENGVNNNNTATTSIFQNINETNLSSANVVGLPNHARYSSVPVSTVQTRATAGIIPVHTRNKSEPSNQFFKPPINNGNLMGSSVPIHYRHSTQVEHSNNVQQNGFRSSSVPKSVPITPRHESITTTTTTTVPSTRFSQKINTNNDISNVNVNFYRAVPVNVISSVPTIHCLNTLSNVQGNEVSNVQVLPLGNPPINNNNNNTITTSINNNSLVVGTTQVILHNTQVQNNNNVQVTTGSTNNNNFYPTHNQVNIQNIRPASVPYANRSNIQVGTTVRSNNDNRNTTTTRTFTSTEAQTDEISILPPVNEQQITTVRDQRRRERRERRQQRRLNNRQSVDTSTQVSTQNDRLPDLLSNHLPPPYTTLSNAQLSPISPLMTNSAIVSSPMLPPPHGAVLQTVVPNNIVPASGFVFQGPPPVGQVPLVQGPAPVAVPVPPPTGFRFPFPATGFRRGRFSEDPPKGCCGILSWKPGSLRWFIALIALVAVCCVLVGTALGAMRPSGRDHLTVSLLMIGVGIVLVTVSGVAWRLTSHDSSTCRSMLGLGSTESVDVCTRRFVPRLPPAYGRPHHPYAAMMYPEFQYRPPPPSYQASMQEYRLRLLLLERGNTPQIQNGIQNAVSPPPTYRSQSGSLLRAPISGRRDAAQSEYSCPPSYRSQSTRPGTLQSNSVLHSREQSLSLSESNHGGSMVNVVNILGSTEEDIALDNITLDSLKMEPEHDLNPVKMMLKGSSSDLEGSKDGNLVTIVQTSDQSPVIVTVSGSSQIDSNNSVQITEIPSEMEILAHL